MDALHLVEEYWSLWVERMTAIKETAVAYLRVATSVSKEEGGFVGVDTRRREISLGDDGAGMAMPRLAHAMTVVKEVVGPLPVFKPLELFLKHLDMEYGGFQRDQMQQIVTSVG